ncbi:hypothetical protein SOV_35920 [Sporomusa ovata DSM 2662]|uniref:Uncharacterized protein n=1 Tax=Sporomusa ovata TaxID=2378 RepID=A0A0U1L734_9FIRM|nr:DUF669 domain-containing protein [Sporomusa ovata]EQB24741.1 hypothetical protein SOV_6c01550 [Sporomusa ovata DSM 2662]CQR75089.1 hypothetical protein SpAn4DRAFT_4453 [Sporomusa ovata]
MANVWEKWNKKIDTAGLKDDVKKAAENKQDFKDVPKGKYEVKLTKLELKATKKTDDPMLSCWMKVLAGQYKGQHIFYNQMLTTGFGIHNANEFLRSLESGVEIEFEDFKQYNDLLMDVMEAVEAEQLEYVLDYGENDKGFKTFKIEDVFTE